MTILLAHELGHYFACRYYGIDASLPYFLPFPSPIGTLGAFIRIRSPIYTRQALFDVGIAGPLAGFALLVPAMAIGLAYSKVIPGIAERGDLIFGVPAIQRALGMDHFPGASGPPTSCCIQWRARPGWERSPPRSTCCRSGNWTAGTSFMHSPADRHKLLSRIFVLALVPLGIFYSPQLAGLGGVAVLLRAAASGDLRHRPSWTRIEWP